VEVWSNDALSLSAAIAAAVANSAGARVTPTRLRAVASQMVAFLIDFEQF